MSYPDSDSHGECLPLEERLARMEQKIDRLFALLFSHLRIVTPPNAEQEEEIKDLLAKLLGQETREQSTLERKPLDEGALRVFKVEINKNGKFEYDPQRWRYPIGSRVQWVSETGSFTISVDPQYSSDRGTPFDGLREIQAEEGTKAGRWQTRVFDVQPLFSQTELSARRLAGAPPLSNRFTVAISKGGKIYIDQSQQGTQC